VVRTDSIAAILARERIDWDRLLRTARRNKVLAFALDRLLGCDLPLSVKRRVHDVAKAEIYMAAHDNHVFRAETAAVVEALRDAGIECLLLKGLTLDRSGLRHIGDIDVMVHEHDVLKAVNVLLTLDGYAYRPASDDGGTLPRLIPGPLSEHEQRRILGQVSWNNEFQVVNVSRHTLVEIHHRIYQPRNPRDEAHVLPTAVGRNTHMFWEQKRYNRELQCYELVPEHALILMCLRSGIKCSPVNGMFRLSVLVDIDTLVDEGIRWDRLTDSSSTLGTSPFVLFSLVLARDLLDTAVPTRVLRRLREDCDRRQVRAMRILRKSFTGLSSSSLCYSKWYMAVSPVVFCDSRKHRLTWRLMLPIWIPSRHRIAMLFGMRPDSPWLIFAYIANPLRWAYRIGMSVLRKDHAGTRRSR